MGEEKLEEYKKKLKRERRRTRRKAILPTFDPTDVTAVAEAAAAGVAGAEAGVATEEKGPRPEVKVKADPQKTRKWLRRKPKPPAADPTPADAASAEPPGHTVPNGKPPPQAVPPIPVPHVNGGSHGDGEGTTANGAPPAGMSHREQVETELQRILDDAGLHTEVDGILADVKAEAQRQGVPIDSEAMLKAICEDTNGIAKLSDSAKGEIESRFKRIVAEERGERGLDPGHSTAARLNCYASCCASGRGEIGRHAAFRSPWAKAHGGSSPSARTPQPDSPTRLSTRTTDALKDALFRMRSRVTARSSSLA